MYRKVILSTLLGLVLGASANPQQTPSPVQTSDRPVLENPSYDPTMYHQFLPQDAVQQYVQSYTGHNYPMAQSYGAPFDNTAFAAIPSKGFEGYLIPAPPVQPNQSLLASFRSVIPSARSLFSFFGQVASIVLGTLGTVAVGTVLTALLCFFTPFCSLSFTNGKFLGNGETAQEVVAAIGEQVTAERVKRAAEFVKVAIDKFQQLNQVVKEATVRKAAQAAQN